MRLDVRCDFVVVLGFQLQEYLSEQSYDTPWSRAITLCKAFMEETSPCLEQSCNTSSGETFPGSQSKTSLREAFLFRAATLTVIFHWALHQGDQILVKPQMASENTRWGNLCTVTQSFTRVPISNLSPILL